MSDEAEDKRADKPKGADKDKSVDKGKGDGKGEGKHFKAGVAVGIGSAAIVAALLYARTGKKSDK